MGNSKTGALEQRALGGGGAYQVSGIGCRPDTRPTQDQKTLMTPQQIIASRLVQNRAQNR